MRFGKLFQENISRKKLKDTDKVVFIGMQDVDENATIRKATHLNYSQVRSGFTYFEKNDVLVAKITPCFENGKGGIANSIPTEVGFGSTEFHVLRAKENADPRYIYFQTKRQKFRNDLEGEMVGSAGHRRVPLSSIQAYELEVEHTKVEQTAIADALSDVDGLIGSLEKLIAKKRAIKTAAMQQLLTGKKRLPPFDQTHTGYKQTDLGEIPNDWEVSPAGSFGRLTTGGTPPTQIKEYWGGEIPWITPSDITKVKNIFITERYITDAGLRCLNVLPAGTVLITCIASIGKNAVLTKAGACNQQINALSPAESNCSDWVYYSIEFASDRLRSIAGITATPIVSKALFSDFPIIAPKDSKEKSAIGNVLSDMDTEIDALEQRLNKTQQLKQGMMQELLTGRTRLI